MKEIRFSQWSTMSISSQLYFAWHESPVRVLQQSVVMATMQCSNVNRIVILMCRHQWGEGTVKHTGVNKKSTTHDGTCMMIYMWFKYCNNRMLKGKGWGQFCKKNIGWMSTSFQHRCSVKNILFDRNIR